MKKLQEFKDAFIASYRGRTKQEIRIMLSQEDFKNLVSGKILEIVQMGR